MPLYTLTSACAFSILFFDHFLWLWQREFGFESKASLFDDHFLYSHDLYVWFKGDNARKNWMLVTLSSHRVKRSNLSISCHKISCSIGNENFWLDQTIPYPLDSSLLLSSAWQCTNIIMRNWVHITTENKKGSKLNFNPNNDLFVLTKCRRVQSWCPCSCSLCCQLLYVFLTHTQ